MFPLFNFIEFFLLYLYIKICNMIKVYFINMNRRYLINEQRISEKDFVSITKIGFANAIRRKHKLFEVYKLASIAQKISVNLN